eukprot:scaffold32301_cov135-Isochrysis_galbana.AAC.4
MHVLSDPRVKVPQVREVLHHPDGVWPQGSPEERDQCAQGWQRLPVQGVDGGAECLVERVEGVACGPLAGSRL